MRSWPPHLYFAAGAKKGRSRDLLIRALKQARVVQDQNGLPAVLSLRHLAESAEVDYVFLRAIVARSHRKPYRVFQVKKRSGGYRTICVPTTKLMQVQRWIAGNILRRVRPHAASHAYTPGASIVDCAQVHCGCRWLIKLDIQQFFESISERQAYQVFRGFGYAPLSAFELARICTRLTPAGNAKYKLKRWRVAPSAFYSIWEYQKPFVGHLPQGAPTSPMLSNLAMRAFDRQVTEFCLDQGLAYTRYADDLIFSTSDPMFDRKSAESLVRSISDLILKYGLRPRATKTVIAPPGARKVVLGLVVNSARPTLSRELKGHIEAHVHHIVTKTPVIHAQVRGFESVFAMQQYIEGMLNFAGQVDAKFANPLRERLRAVRWPI